LRRRTRRSVLYCDDTYMAQIAVTRFVVQKFL
jgi:hypothetical protein